jgi:hypothetical protein
MRRTGISSGNRRGCARQEPAPRRLGPEGLAGTSILLPQLPSPADKFVARDYIESVRRENQHNLNRLTILGALPAGRCAISAHCGIAKAAPK